MILLSYTVLDNYTKASHTYLNKAMGIITPETDAMKEGKAAHIKLQAHLLGNKIPNLNLNWDATDVEYHAKKNVDNEYTWHGYLDAVNFKSKVGFEIKTGSPWSQQKFDRSIQPKYYSFVTGLKKFVFITCKFDLSDLKVYYKEMTQQDWDEAKEWAETALKGIKAGEFKGGLDENGRCLGCSYGTSCFFA